MNPRDWFLKGGWRIATVLLLCGWVPPFTAHAKQSLSLQIASVDWSGRTGAGYDVFDPSPYSQTVNFSVTHRGSAGAFFVTFSKDTPGTAPRQMMGAGTTLDYQIYDSPSLGNVLQDLPSASPREVISGSFPSGQDVRALSFVVTLPARQSALPGNYTDSVRVSLYDGTLGQHELAVSVVIQVRTRVLETLELALLEFGAPFAPAATTRALNFGSLSEGRSLGFDLRIRANTGYTVTLASENGGVLRLTDQSGEDAVPYRLDFRGATVQWVVQPVVVLSQPPAVSGGDGESHPVWVTIGALGAAAAGEYRDVVTVTILANN